MYTELWRDHGSKLPVVVQPQAGVVLTVWSEAGNRVTATVHEHGDGSLSFRLETYDRRSKIVELHADGKVPTPTIPVAPEATSEQREASTEEPDPTKKHRWLYSHHGCRTCGGDDYRTEIHTDPSLMTDHPLNMVGKPGKMGMQCGDCPEDAPVAPIYHPK